MLIKRKEDVPLVRLIAMARDAAAGVLHLHQYVILTGDVFAWF